MQLQLKEDRETQASKDDRQAQAIDRQAQVMLAIAEKVGRTQDYNASGTRVCKAEPKVGIQRN